MSPRRRLLAVTCLAAVVLLCCSPLLAALWEEFRYARLLGMSLDGPIEYVKFQPNTDWPKRRITDPDKTVGLKSWLLATDKISRLRSAPPRTVCEMRFVFKDGHDVVIMHSPFRKPLGNEGLKDVRSDVGIRLGSHYRSGPAASLERILDRSK